MLDVVDLPTPGGGSSGVTISQPRATSVLSTMLSAALTGGSDQPVVHLTGELDIASRTTVVAVCTSEAHREVVVDLTDLTFMDCSGYGTLVSARLVLTVRGGSLALAGVNGQPLRLLSLIAGSERAAEVVR